MKLWLILLIALVGQSARVAADQAPLTFAQAVGEALRASPALRAPDDGRMIAQIRQQQAAAGFGFKLTPTFQTGTDQAGLNARSMGVLLSKKLPTGTTLQVNASTFEFGTLENHIRDSGILGRHLAAAAARMDVGGVGGTDRRQARRRRCRARSMPTRARRSS